MEIRVFSKNIKKFKKLNLDRSRIIAFLFLLISLGASIIGAICGIGGGVIIKPVLDAVGIYNVAVISFLSGCTVLSMSLYSVGITLIKQETKINLKISIILSIGAAKGGIIGKQIFSSVWISFANKNTPGLIQAICLVVLTVLTFIYMVNRSHINTHRINNIFGIWIIGLILGLFSSFLGIGGGPINLVVLFYFFSMETKMAAENSLFIILFSQITSLLTTVITNTVPNVDMLLLVIMIVGGIAGGMLGKIINRRIKAKTVEKLFMILMVIIILINIYNVYQFCI